MPLMIELEIIYKILAKTFNKKYK